MPPGVLRPYRFFSVMEAVCINSMPIFTLLGIMFAKHGRYNIKQIHMNGQFERKYLNHQVTFILGDDVVPYKYGDKSANTLTSAGFRSLQFKSFDGYLIYFDFSFFFSTEEATAYSLKFVFWI